VSVALSFYLDEDSMNRALSRALQDRGIEVLNAVDTDQASKSDEEQLEFATARSLVLFSFNVGDFARLHQEWLAKGRSHAGIVVGSQQRYGVGEILRRLLNMSSKRTTSQMQDQLEFLSAWGES